VNLAEFVDAHPFISLGISHAFLFVAGYLLKTVRVGFTVNRIYDEWLAAEADPLTQEYLRSPIRDAVIPVDEDDWTGYQQAVRPTQVIQVGARPEPEPEPETTRNWDVYLAELPRQNPAAAPVSPAFAYLGTPGYVGRHSAEGRTETQVRALNTSTGSFPVLNPNALRVLDQGWRDNVPILETRELELV